MGKVSDVEPELRVKLDELAKLVTDATTAAQVGFAEIRGTVNTLQASVEGRMNMSDSERASLKVRVDALEQHVGELRITRGQALGLAGGMSVLVGLVGTAVGIVFG